MTHLFSPEVKELVARSREIAIDLGYDYISSIHFFLADCESDSPSSIFNFRFNNKVEYLIFKKSLELHKEDHLSFLDENIPLTFEAETAIRNSLKEIKTHKSKMVYPCHLMLAAVKDNDSLLVDKLGSRTTIARDFMQYYKETGELENHFIPKKNNRVLFWLHLSKRLKWRND